MGGLLVVLREGMIGGVERVGYWWYCENELIRH